MFNFKYIDFYDSYSVIEDIIADKITGVVLNNALSEFDCCEIIDLIHDLKSEYFTDLNEGSGYSLPSMFGQLHKSLSRDLATKYFTDIGPFAASVNSICKSDFNQKILVTLKRAFQPLAVNNLPGFLPYSFRIVYPKKLGLSLHRDRDLFPYIQEDVANRISMQINVDTLMSWFFAIQLPEKGGELWIGDSSYNSYYKIDEILIGENGQKVLPTDIAHIKVQSTRGSLLLFKGGSYWHKVLPPAQNCSERITLGGFMALSISGDSILVWS